MWTSDKNFPARGFSTPPPPPGKSRRWSPGSPMWPMSEKKRSSPQTKADLFHIIHKVPAGDSPYVRAKHVQLIDKDPNKAISLFWAAINSGDRVDSALKDMAVVMKQLNRSDEAIEAVKSFRHLCPPESQESLDNILLELYKRSGRTKEQIEMLEIKVKNIEEGMAFGGKTTKYGRSQGRKIQITVEQEYSRLLGNLAWAYMQQKNFKSAEELYRKALSLEPDKNKQCNLAICLMHMNKLTEAKFLLHTIRASSEGAQVDDSYGKSFERATQILAELESRSICEEENDKEILTPISSFVHANLKEFSTSEKGEQNYVSASRRSVSGRDKEALRMDEQNRESCSRGKHENSCSDTRNSNYRLYRQGNRTEVCSSSRVNSRKGTDREKLSGRRADLCRNRNDKWFSAGGMEQGSFCRMPNASPFSATQLQKVPSTQPRRCSPSSIGGFRGDGGVGCCNRKLSFKQPMADESLRLPVTQNGHGKPADNPSSFVNRDWRKRPWGDYGESEGVSSQQPIAKVGSADLVIGGPAAVDVNSRVGEAFSARDCVQGFPNISTVNGAIISETDEHKCCAKKSLQKHDSCCDLIAENVDPIGNLKQFHDSSTCRSKKTWADMVEEDEQGSSSGRTNCLERKQVYPSQESPFSSKTATWGCDGWSSGEYNDENKNSNETHQLLTPLNQIENLSQKMESFDLKDGYYTQPGNPAFPTNRTVRRPLCFDQQQEPGRSGDYGSSPLPKKTLNFEGRNNSWLENGREETSGSGVKLLRRNRLQVFRDITLSCESPRGESEENNLSS
ncbi:uncharacterized protein LOC127807718 [Diospyros lotus]|uniref:uncharacterized protein LOC127807718 n=1 Tax=Diospyros lotus TaxID=55363 RepID=UPI002258A669|nr:uncharacterized protein LOC127807718 [Diospyros lotus]